MSHYVKFHECPRPNLVSSANFLVLGKTGGEKKKKKGWEESILEQCLLLVIIPINSFLMIRKHTGKLRMSSVIFLQQQNLSAELYGNTHNIDFKKFLNTTGG